MVKERSFFTTVLLLAVPNILQQLITNLTQMVDNLMVGQLQEHSIAAVTITNQVFFVFMLVLIGTGAAGGIFIPQYKGIGNDEKVTETINIALFFSLIIGTIFFILMTVSPDAILRIFAEDPLTLEKSHEYLRFIRWTFLLFPISLAIGNGFRFSGMVKIPLYVAIVTVIVNAFFNFSLIHGNFGFPALGVVGAGIGTLIARGVEMLIFVGMTFYLKSPIKLKFQKFFRFDKKLFRAYIQKGYGLVINEFFWAFGMQILVVIYTQRISMNIAAMSIADALGNMLFIGIPGMAVAIGIILGENLGQGKFEQAKADATRLLKIASLLGQSLGVLVIILSFFVFGLYDVAPETINIARNVLLIRLGFAWLYYLNAGHFFILRAGGDTRSVLLMDSGFNWAIMIPFALLAGRFGFILPIHFFIVQFTEFVKLFIARRMLKKGTWLNNLTVE